ncbi:MAG TPA: AAA family ATPase [Rikenellaceae bacterium]|nr:AAA family ATPase [Rikenellaceae bacterium]
MLYPIGIQNFEKIRQGGFVYIDKTDLIYKIAQTGQYYFLSRPRRFGKSLLVSTMEAYFQGKKELFDGLAIASLEKDWTEYPVLHFDLSGASYTDMEALNDKIGRQLETLESRFGVVKKYKTFPVRFDNLIECAYNKTGRQVVILIDEYDKPVIDNLDSPELQDKMRETLRGFYGVMKGKDGYIRFGFLTGVTKIGKMSVFSDLNNLKDISMDARYTDICGISEADLKDYFSDSVRELAEANGLTDDECRQKLALMYDGYHFCEDSIGVYNPFSLLNTFDSMKFKEYWFETGTPSFLVKVMKNTSYDITSLSEQEADSSLLTDISSAFLNPVPLLYQSGYLTIKGYDEDFQIYHLGFPNREVKHGFLNYLMPYYTPVGSETPMMLISRMTRDIRSGNPESFMTRLDALFARTNYQIQADCEKDFQYAMYIIIELMGEYVETERTTSNGRIDILIKTKDYVYVIEIKTDSTPDEALAQIEERGYARPFADDPRRIFKIGVNFSTANRRIDGWKVV